jgi:transposase-like protein
MGKPKNDRRSIIAAYKTSGQSQTEWCRINNVGLGNLRYWLQKEKKEAISPKETREWLAIAIGEQEPNHNQHLTLQIGQVRIEVKPEFDPTLLSKVVKTLIAIC